MKEDSILNFDKLVKLFSLFVLGSVSLFVYYRADIPNFSWKGELMNGIFIMGILCGLFVILTLATYYFTNGKEKLIKDFNKRRSGYFIGTVIIIAVIYLLFVLIKEGVMSFLQNLLIVFLGLIAINPINKKITKWWNKLGKKN
jgi:hypothetical protein